jgi:hypothetical protein
VYTGARGVQLSLNEHFLGEGQQRISISYRSIAPYPPETTLLVAGFEGRNRV